MWRRDDDSVPAAAAAAVTVAVGVVDAGIGFASDSRVVVASVNVGVVDVNDVVVGDVEAARCNGRTRFRLLTANSLGLEQDLIAQMREREVCGAAREDVSSA